MRKVEKPWGHEIIWAQTNKYVGKVLYIKEGHRLSRQYHKIKEETVFVLSGTLRIWKSDDEKDYVDLRPGESYHVLPNQIHRFGCPKNSKYATSIMEVSTPYLEDVIRLADDYKR